MKKWMICVVVCFAAACAKQAEPGAPIQFAPAGSPAPPPQAEPSEEEASDEVELAPAEKAKSAPEDSNSAPAEMEASGDSKMKDAESDGAKGNKLEHAVDAPSASEARSAESPKKLAPKSASSAPCDANCTKLCASAKDKTKCAEAYGKGCFDGSAPAAFDCEGFGKKPAEGGDGVKLQDTPTVPF